METHCLPFEVGQEAESKSFLSGFCGAWFRCKINGIRRLKGNINYSLEYFDFPDEKIRWTKLYQKPSTKGTGQKKKMHLMVRPRFPPVFRESQMPDICAISEVVAIVDDVWRVGDLVDWMADGCYWLGTITHLLGEDKVKIKLPEPPVGEGMSYDASCKDLRPSLDWSSELGWTVPISMESETTHCCVRLIQPKNQGEGEDKNEHCEEGEPCDTGAASVQSHDSYEISPSSSKQTEKELSDTEPNKEVADLCEDSAAAAVSSHGSLPSSEEQILKQSSEDGSKKKRQVLDSGDNGIGSNPTSQDRVSERPDSGEDCLVETGQMTKRGDRYNCSSSTKDRNSTSSAVGFMNSSFSDTLEANVLDLEELANRIKWLKRVHQFGLQSANATVPSWKFLEERVSSAHNR